VTHDYPVHTSGEVVTGNLFADNGYIVGLSPAVASTPSGLVIAYRDVHGGQFPTDYAKSDWEAAVGSPGNWAHQMIQMGTDTTNPDFVHVGLGELTTAAQATAGLGVLSCGKDDLDSTPKDLFFALYSGGVWSKQAKLRAVGNAGLTGGSLAGDAQEGFGAAWVDLTTQILSFTTSPDGTSWTNPEQVYGQGSGGWEPSLAYDPNHLATVAFYVCAARQGVTQCPASEDGLWVSVRRAPHVWDPVLVDEAGGRRPQLLYNGGQMIVIYRDLDTGGVKIARQRPPS